MGFNFKLYGPSHPKVINKISKVYYTEIQAQAKEQVRNALKKAIKTHEHISFFFFVIVSFLFGNKIKQLATKNQ